MKSIKLIIIASILSCFSLTCLAQGKLKIIEKSSRKQPIWLNSTENEYIITSAISNNIEKAKEMCMDNVKKSIIDAVAQNVKSSDQSTISQETVNSEIVNFLDK
ncbi:MAG: hypothetical protein IMY73_04755, partial [Bacteroidetes bacterium]|nr:hypothetical protein [Bacteroidota bacterium]